MLWKYIKTNGPIFAQSDISRKMGDYNIGTLVKEFGQNAIDASIGKKVGVYFDILEISLEDKSKILNAFGIDSSYMIKKLELMKNVDENEKSRFEMMQKLFTEEKNFFILRIMDTGTEGLTGSEDITLEKRKNTSNFQGFFFKFGLSEKSSGQGSFGEGRMAIIAASLLQMVFTISHLSKQNKDFFHPYRLFGMGCHGPFTEENQNYQGMTYYGNVNNSKVVPSSIGSHYNSKNLLFPPEIEHNSGTVFYLPFFDPRKGIMEENSHPKGFYVDKFFQQLNIEIQK